MKSTRGFGLFEGFLAKKRAQMANKLIEPKYREGRILDIGCGAFPHFLVETTFAEKHGIDLDVHEDSKSGNVNLTRVDLEKEKLPFRQNYFDVVVALAVFEHINPEILGRFLRDIYRVLKRGGIFILTTPAPHAHYLLWLLARIRLVSKIEIDDHKTAYSRPEILELLSMADFLRQNVKHGSFELGFNMWFTVQK